MMFLPAQRRVWLVPLFGFLLGCAPRDGEPPSPRISLEAAGEKLPTCSGPSDPTWNTLRLHPEFASVFPNIGKMRVVLGKGSRNCLPVSPRAPIEVELAVAEGEFRRSGVFYFVTEIVLLDTRDFLADAGLVADVARGMGLQPEQLIAIVNGNPRRDQVTLSYLSPAGGGSLQEGATDLQELVTQAGSKLSTCQKDTDPTWDTIRLFAEMEEIFPSLPQLRQIVGKGGRNCVPVDSGAVTLQTQQSPGGPFQNSSVQVRVLRIERLATEALLADTTRLQQVAQDMQWTAQGLVEFLESPPRMPELTITTVIPFSDSDEVDAPPTPPGVEPAPQVPLEPEPTTELILKLPEDSGRTLGDCETKWSELRLPGTYPLKAWLALTKQEARLIVLPGETNCLPVGAELRVVGAEELPPLRGRVRALIRRQHHTLLTDPLLLLYLAEDAGLSAQELGDYVKSLTSPWLNLTEVVWEN